MKTTCEPAKKMCLFGAFPGDFPHTPFDWWKTPDNSGGSGPGGGAFYGKERWGVALIATRLREAQC